MGFPRRGPTGPSRGRIARAALRCVLGSKDDHEAFKVQTSHSPHGAYML